MTVSDNGFQYLFHTFESFEIIENDMKIQISYKCIAGSAIITGQKRTGDRTIDNPDDGSFFPIVKFHRWLNCDFVKVNP